MATAAAHAALELVREASPALRFVGVTDSRNAPSIRVLQKLGMRLVESRSTLFKGERCEELVFSRHAKVTESHCTRLDTNYPDHAKSPSL